MQRTLFDAIEDGDLIEIRALLNAGANVEGRDVLGWTPLIYAALQDQPQTIRLLLDHGADAEARDVYGRTAREYALREQLADATHALTVH